MRLLLSKLACLLLVVVLLTPEGADADTLLVTTQQEFKKAVKGARPGDVIQLANGTWDDFEMLFTGEGKADQPITLTAQEKGKVIISGRSNLRLAGTHLVVSGLVFKDGYTPTSEVISFRRNKDHLANDSRVTETVIDHFNNPERTEPDFWVIMYGRNNRFDHNHLVGKGNRGVTMAVRLNSKESQENHHRIDHNYFGPRPVLGSNGGESLRIGTSHYSMSDSFTLVENNYFDRCDGEVEIISSKSGSNVFRGNLFYESRGTLTLRHGNGTLVENNVFLGNGVDHTGGIRVINKRQTVRNNYLYKLKGYRFGSALTIMNGVPNSPINRYHQVEDSVIENNSVIDSDYIEMAAGSDEERSAVPKTSTFRNNLIYNADGRNVIRVNDDVSGITFEDNVLNRVESPAIENGFISQEVTLVKAGNGLNYPEGGNVGASRDLKVLEKSDTGVSWYPKPQPSAVFGNGSVHAITAEEDALENAVQASAAGDVIELAAGEYTVRKLLQVAHPLTVRAATGAAVNIEFERPALFDIQDGGSLELKDLHISGRAAPDSAGNAVVRSSRYSMLRPYRLRVEDCEITDLDVNHSFNFLTVFPSTFADQVEIHGSTFRNVSGHILALEQEKDDLGRYNVEYVAIANSVFENVGKTLAALYRGGTDESTFGPHFHLHHSELTNVGHDKRNTSGASILLHGVQVANISDNRMMDSRPIRVELIVGDPKTVIRNNQFSGTPAPEVTGGEIVLEDNQKIGGDS